MGVNIQTTRLGWARHGQARQGWARHGQARLGWAGHGWAGHGKAGYHIVSDKEDGKCGFKLVGYDWRKVMG